MVVLTSPVFAVIDIISVASINFQACSNLLNQGQSLIQRASDPRSNLILVDAQQRDVEPVRTATLIGKVVDKVIWRIVVQDHTSTRYTS